MSEYVYRSLSYYVSLKVIYIARRNGPNLVLILNCNRNITSTWFTIVVVLEVFLVAFVVFVVLVVVKVVEVLVV